MSIEANGTVESRLASLGLTLPKAAPAVANYQPFVITGNLVMTSGNLPWRDGVLAFKGAIGSQLTIDDGYLSCQLSCLNAIAQLKAAAGDLAAIRRIVRMEGTMNVAPGCFDHPKALNGASDLLAAAFLERNQHTRMIYANPVMPMDCTSLVVLFAEIERAVEKPRIRRASRVFLRGFPKLAPRFALAP